jgi:putative polyketide hydroxylase
VTTRVPVLICGGGIAGLTAALLLRRESVFPVLVEKHASLSPQPKARRFHPRSTEIFRMLGLADEISAASPPLGSFGVLTGSTLAEAQSPAPSDNLRRMRKRMAGMSEMSPGPNVSVPQSVLEPVLRRAAEQRGVSVRFGTELVSFNQDDKGVTAVLRPTDGEPYELTADYLIAADGADSPIRNSLGINRSGYGHIADNVDLYFRADLTDLARDKPFILCQIENSVASGTIWMINGTDRWLFSSTTDFPGASTLSDSEWLDILKTVVGVPDLEVDLLDRSPWESAMRMADRLCAGRIFLAGDAAHVMPPMAAAGANTAVADMTNLAWKLAAVLTGTATPALLDSYHTERHPEDLAAAEISITSSGDAFGMVSAYINADGMPGDPLATMFGTQYEQGAFVPDGRDPAPVDHYAPAGRPGTRVPHAWLDATTSILDLIGPGLTLLTGPDNGRWITKADRLGVRLAKVAHQDWLAEVFLPANGALLVRPDAVIAWHSNSETQLADALVHVLGTIPALRT